jgi:hypothetical protein
LSRRLGALAVTLLAGCTITIEPGIEGISDEKIPTIESGAAQPQPGPLPRGSSRIVSKYGLNTYVIDRAAWNGSLAAALERELRTRGVSVVSGPKLLVTVEGFTFDQIQLGMVYVFQIDLEIEVQCGSFRRRYLGQGTTPSSSSNATWKAAGHCLTQLLADPGFVAAIGG